MCIEFGWFGKVESKSNSFTGNTVVRAWDSRTEATGWLDYDLKEQTIAKLKEIDGIFICLEQPPKMTKKWIDSYHRDIHARSTKGSDQGRRATD